MTVGVRRLLVGGVLAVCWGCHAAGTLHVETILNKGDSKSGTRSILGCVCGVKEIGEEETDELEGH